MTHFVPPSIKRKENTSPAFKRIYDACHGHCAPKYKSSANPNFPHHTASCSFLLNKTSIHHVLCKKNKFLAYKNFYRISSIFGLLVYGRNWKIWPIDQFIFDPGRDWRPKLISFIYISFGLGKQKGNIN